jgi:hypothetical protein
MESCIVSVRNLNLFIKNTNVGPKMMMMSTVYDTNWIFLMLAHWNNSPRVDMSHDSDTLLWFQANHSLILFLSAACLGKKKSICVFPIAWSMFIGLN